MRRSQFVRAELPRQTRNWPSLTIQKLIDGVDNAVERTYAFSQTALEKVALLGSWFRAQSEKISSKS
jgi:hypothetical protein